MKIISQIGGKKTEHVFENSWYRRRIGGLTIPGRDSDGRLSPGHVCSRAHRWNPVRYTGGTAQEQDGSYMVEQTGNEATSGMLTYDIYFWVEGDHTNTPWQIDAPSTSVIVTPDDDRAYWFISQATDRAGLVQLVHSAGDINTEIAVIRGNDILFPLISRQWRTGKPVLSLVN